MLSRARQDDGVTLVEAIVAGFLLLIGVLGSMSVFDSSGRGSATGERQQIAVEQAQAELEKLRDLPSSELAVNTATDSWPDEDLRGDPFNRLSADGTSFRVEPGTSEELATTDSGGIVPYDLLQVPAGGTTIGMRVYRFITWRDVECPIADLSGLTGGFEPLINANEDILTTLLGSNSRLNALLGSLLNVVPVAVRSRLTSARALATTIQNEIIELNAALGELDEIDPCDTNVASLQQAQANLGALEPALDAVDDAVLAYRNACVSVAGVVISCPSLTSAAGRTLNNVVTQLEQGDLDQDLTALVDSISELDAVDHVRNTRRLTVAVAFAEERTGSGPDKPVWVTSIASDPDAGLLASP